MTPVITPDWGAMLNEAYAAQQAVALGQTPRILVDQNGERIEYGPTNMATLTKWIAYLEVKAGVTTTVGFAASVYMGF